MCKCTPEIRTPFCGKPGCEAPAQQQPAAIDAPARYDMKEQNPYGYESHRDLELDPDGDWVRWDDYERLQQELARSESARVAILAENTHYKQRVTAQQEEIEVADKLIAERNRLLDAIPRCPAHGACVPHAIEWVQARLATPAQSSSNPIVARLRDAANNWNSGGRFAAADEIERLERELAEVRGHYQALIVKSHNEGTALEPAATHTLTALLREARPYIESFANFTKHSTASRDAMALVARIRERTTGPVQSPMLCPHGLPLAENVCGPCSHGEPNRQWLIRKRGYWYRPNRAGYTMSIAEAGRYTEAEAKAEAAIEPSIMQAMSLAEALHFESESDG